MEERLPARVVAVSRSATHGVRKRPAEAIRLLTGSGVEGDVHAGALVRHRYDRRRDPTRPNDRQVHLVSAQLFDELTAAGYAVGPGDLGENIVTQGIDLDALPLGTRLRIGADAIVELRMWREPCVLLERVAPGLRAATTTTRDGAEALRHGVMGIVIASGDARAGDPVVSVVR